MVQGSGGALCRRVGSGVGVVVAGVGVGPMLAGKLLLLPSVPPLVPASYGLGPNGIQHLLSLRHGLGV
jgi:hypothetical protein